MGATRMPLSTGEQGLGGGLHAWLPGNLIICSELELRRLSELPPSHSLVLGWKMQVLSASPGPDLWAHRACSGHLVESHRAALDATSCPQVCLQMASSIFHQCSLVSMCLSVPWC